MFKYFNTNPGNNRVSDCVIRAIGKALGCSWESAYIGLTAEGVALHDMPSSNYVWGMYLRKNGFDQHMADSVCPSCISVSRFADEHPTGTYVLATQNRVVCCQDGDYYELYDCGDEIVLYFFEKEIS